jgi:UDPglucose 6-dehydrogenase
VHDPEAGDNARKAAPHLDYAEDVAKLCEDADIVLHLTEWPQYQAIDPFALRAVVRNPVVLDARNALPQHRWREAGWTIRCMGTGHSPAAAGLMVRDAQEETCES